MLVLVRLGAVVFPVLGYASERGRFSLAEADLSMLLGTPSACEDCESCEDEQGIAACM
jgi:hypothetical protein